MNAFRGQEDTRAGENREKRPLEAWAEPELRPVASSREPAGARFMSRNLGQPADSYAGQVQGSPSQAFSQLPSQDSRQLPPQASRQLPPQTSRQAPAYMPQGPTFRAGPGQREQHQPFYKPGPAYGYERDKYGHYPENSAPGQPHPAPDQREKGAGFVLAAGRLGIKLALIGLVFSLIFGLIFGLNRYRYGDMAEGVKAGDLVLFYRLNKNYQSSDLAVMDVEGERHVFRVAAVAGDQVDINGQGLLIDGLLQESPYSHNPTQTAEEGISFPITLGPGEVFLISDKRQNTTDSRTFGPVQQKDTLGKVIAIYRSRIF